MKEGERISVRACSECSGFVGKNETCGVTPSAAGGVDDYDATTTEARLNSAAPPQPSASRRRSREKRKERDPPKVFSSPPSSHTSDFSATMKSQRRQLIGRRQWMNLITVASQRQTHLLFLLALLSLNY